MKTFTVLITALLLSSCMGSYAKMFDAAQQKQVVRGNKNYVTKSFNVTSFDKLKVNSNANISYTQQAGAPEIEVQTSDNILPLLDINVKDGTLSIGFKKGVRVNVSKLNVRIASNTLRSMVINGSGDIEWKAIQTDNFQVVINGSGNITGSQLQCKQFKTRINGSGEIRLETLTSSRAEAEINGSGDIRLSGQTEQGHYKISGSGSIRADKLQAQRVSARISGSGEILCQAEQTLDVRITGSGKVGYKGEPAITKSSDKKKQVYPM